MFLLCIRLKSYHGLLISSSVAVLLEKHAKIACCVSLNIANNVSCLLHKLFGYAQTLELHAGSSLNFISDLWQVTISVILAHWMNQFSSFSVDVRNLGFEKTKAIQVVP